MKRLIPFLSLALVLSLTLWLPASGYASDDDHFSQMDANHDSSVTWDEFQPHHHGVNEDMFHEYAGEDGVMDAGEWHKYEEHHGGGEHKGMHDGHKN